jgi:RNA polymerase-binding transcription factor DksA
MAADGLRGRSQICEEIERVQAQAETFRIQLRQGFDWGGDDVDKANDLVERAKALALYRHLLQEHRRLEHARTRLDQGLDGACEVCGWWIDPARLKAIIGTTRCLTCQRHLEQGIRRRFRA